MLLLPTWSIVHSRHWKMQIPYLARHCRVLTFDGRGNGRSDRPPEPDAYREEEFAADALAVMDATGTERAVAGVALAGRGTVAAPRREPPRARRRAGVHRARPCRCRRLRRAAKAEQEFSEPRDDYDGWDKWNRHYWLEHYEDFLEFFFSQCFTEPHSTKQREDASAGRSRPTPRRSSRPSSHRGSRTRTSVRELLAPHPLPGARHPRTRRRRPPLRLRRTRSRSSRTARSSVLEGSGHLPHARDPVKVNLLLRDFVAPPRSRRAAGCAASPAAGARSTSPRRSGSATPSATWRSPTSCASSIPTSRSTGWRSTRSRPCSRREASGSIRPARILANESHHIESESAEHDLHCFQAIRRMDEILLANFMVFHDLVREEQYDLWIGDEAWELDYYLHENPEQKRTPYVWLTDFVGWLPMPDGGDHEAFLTADYNAEMIEHIARFPRVRDQARLRRQPRRHRPRAVRARTSPGSATGPRSTIVRRLRHRLRPGRVRRPGGAAGRARLRRGRAGLHRHGRRLGRRRRPAAAGDRRLPGGQGARAGAADDRRRRARGSTRRRCRAHDGLEIRAYVHDLYRHLAACDLAVVQGGLTTSMELTANRRPFLYFPLRHHFEQNFHVRHRLERYGAGRRMDFERETPETIAAAIAETIGRDGRLPAGRVGRRGAGGGADRASPRGGQAATPQEQHSHLRRAFSARRRRGSTMSSLIRVSSSTSRATPSGGATTLELRFAARPACSTSR